MAAARMQRYVMYLAAHNYSIEYRSTKKHCNADGLSRLPLDEKGDEESSTDLWICSTWNSSNLYL